MSSGLVGYTAAGRGGQGTGVRGRGLQGDQAHQAPGDSGTGHGQGEGRE